jgi:hypothetical protein
MAQHWLNRSRMRSLGSTSFTPNDLSDVYLPVSETINLLSFPKTGIIMISAVEEGEGTGVTGKGFDDV